MKKLVLMHGPFNTRSGYGDHARSIFYALYDSKKYDMKVLDCRWGDTPRNHLQKNNLRHKALIDCFLNEPVMDRQPDIYIDVRIPNEFENLGKYNIGVTAGIETNAVSQKWLEGCNKMDMIIVPSEHSKAGFVNTVYDEVREGPDGQKQKIGQVTMNKPIEVIFEGIDEDVFRPLEVKHVGKKILRLVNDVVKENFAFLFVGQWVKGGYGSDRKDIARLIKVFYESFANTKKQPALVLKTSGATFSVIDRDTIHKKINSIKNQFPKELKLPNIYLLHGDLDESEMNDLYNHPKIKYMISLTHGEGFGRPLLEATMAALPVITTPWSGQADFLNPKYTTFFKGALESVPKDAVWEDIVIAESSWFTVDEHNVYEVLKAARDNYYAAKNRAKTMMRHNREKFTYQKMLELINKVIGKYTKDIATPVSLNLPKLQKTSDSPSPELKLPSLKRIT